MKPAAASYIASSTRRLLGEARYPSERTLMEGRRLLRFVTKRHVVGRVIQIAIRSSRPPTSKLSHTSIYHPPHVKLFLLRTQDTLYNVTNHRSLRSHLSYSCTNQTRCYPMKTLRHESGKISLAPTSVTYSTNNRTRRSRSA